MNVYLISGMQVFIIIHFKTTNCNNEKKTHFFVSRAFVLAVLLGEVEQKGNDQSSKASDQPSVSSFNKKIVTKFLIDMK